MGISDFLKKATTMAFRSKVVRPLQNYNVEERAMKIISKERPTAAPPHPSMKKMMDDIKNDPKRLIEKSQPDLELSKQLKDVFITSTGDNPIDSFRLKPQANFPKKRTIPEEFDFGFYEPDRVPPGKLSFRELLALLTKHNDDPDIYTEKKLAKEYDLDEETVKNITHYFKLFSLYIPREKPQPSNAILKVFKPALESLKKITKRESDSDK